MSEEKEVNKIFFYRGNDIVKLWEQYLKSLNADLKFYLNSEPPLASIFTGIAQNYETALVLNSDNSPYLNKDGYSLTLCGEVNYVEDNKIDDTNSIKNKLPASIKQVKDYNDTHDTKITNHIIIFPYHAGLVHWNLGKIKLVFNSEDNSLIEAYIDIYEPLGGQASGYNSLIEDINSLEDFRSIKISRRESVAEQIKQQYDGSSCGAITAENGKEFLKDKADETNLLKSSYQAGANELRAQHIDEINEEAFYVAQRDNIAYEPKGDKPIENRDEIIKVLMELIQKPENSWIRQFLIQQSKKDTITRENLDIFKQFLMSIDTSSKTDLPSQILKSNGQFREGACDLIETLAVNIPHSSKGDSAHSVGQTAEDHQQTVLSGAETLCGVSVADGKERGNSAWVAKVGKGAEINEAGSLLGKVRTDINSISPTQSPFSVITMQESELKNVGVFKAIVARGKKGEVIDADKHKQLGVHCRKVRIFSQGVSIPLFIRDAEDEVILK